MAKDDNSVIFLKDWKVLIQSLSTENQLLFWELFTSYEYESNQECHNDYVRPIWNFVKSQLDNMKHKYITKTVLTNQLNGLKGGRPRKTQENPKNPLGLSETEITPKDKDKDKDNNKEKEKDIPPAASKPFTQFSKEDFHLEVKPFVEKYGKQTCRDFFNYWTEPNARGKMRFQLEKTWSVSNRLSTWKKNEGKFGNTEVPKQQAKVIPGPWNV